jgi:hypothetical protein
MQLTLILLPILKHGEKTFRILPPVPYHPLLPEIFMATVVMSMQLLLQIQIMTLLNLLDWAFS